MHLPFRQLPGFGLATLLTLALGLAACDTSRHGVGEALMPEYNTKPTTINRQIAEVTDEKVTYKTSQTELATAFIREFGDGTVVDKVQVRAAPAGPNEAKVYYLIGMGQRNGMFRAMALPLLGGADNAVLLSPAAKRYVLTGVGCVGCFFNFEGDRITGAICDGNAGGGQCHFKIELGNTLFPAANRD